MLITMAVMTLLLGSMAVLFRAGVQCAGYTTVQTTNMATARAALQTVLGEYRQAQSLDAPASGVTDGAVTFTRPAPDGSGTPMHVRYWLTEGVLWRKAWVGATEPADDRDNTMGVMGSLFAVSFTSTTPVLRMQVTVDRLATDGQQTPSAATLDGKATPWSGR